MRLESGNGSGRSKTPFTTLKMTAFAPIPIAKVKIATIAKPGLRRSMRALKRKSCQSVPIHGSQETDGDASFYFLVTICLPLKREHANCPAANEKQKNHWP